MEEKRQRKRIDYARMARVGLEAARVERSDAFLPCSSCERHIITVVAFSMHIAYCSKIPHQCPVCSKSDNSSLSRLPAEGDDAEVKTDVPDEKEEAGINEEVCSAKLDDEHTEKREVSNAETKESTTSKHFLCAEELDQHMELEHSDYFAFTCWVCDLEFKRLTILQKHQLKEHKILVSTTYENPSKQLNCTACSLEFDSVTGLTEHLKKNKDCGGEVPVDRCTDLDSDVEDDLLFRMRDSQQIERQFIKRFPRSRFGLSLMLRTDATTTTDKPITPTRSRQSVTPSRFRQSVTPSRGRQSVTPSRFRQSVSSNRGRQSVSSSRGRQSVSSNRGRQAVSLHRPQVLPRKRDFKFDSLQNAVQKRKRGRPPLYPKDEAAMKRRRLAISFLKHRKQSRKPSIDVDSYEMSETQEGLGDEIDSIVSELLSKSSESSKSKSATLETSKKMSWKPKGGEIATAAAAVNSKSVRGRSRGRPPGPRKRMRVSTVSDDQVAIITSPKRRRLSPNTSGLVDSDDENFDVSASPYTPLRGRSLGLEPEGASDEDDDEISMHMVEATGPSCDLDEEDDDVRAAPAVELNVCRACGMAFDSFSEYTRHMQQVHNLALQSPPPPSSKPSMVTENIESELPAPRKPGRPSLTGRRGPGRPRTVGIKAVPGETPPDKENGPPARLSCPTCDKCFTDEGPLRQHMRWSHRGLLPVLSEAKPKGRGRGRKPKIKVEELESDLPGSSLLMPSWSAALPTQPTPALLCPLCPDRPSFMSSDAREAHLATEHDGERAFGCQSCGETFSLFYELQLHTRQEHDVGGETPALVEDPARAKLAYKCVVCKVGFHVETVLQRHYDAMHTLDEGEQYHCPVCYFTYSGCRTRDDHVLKKHPDARAFKCPVCEARFASFEVFRAHEKRAHISQKTRMRGSSAMGESGGSLLGLPEKPKKPPRRKLAAAMRGALAEKSNDTAEVLAQKRRESRVYKEGTLLCEKCGEDCANEEELDIHTKEHVRKEKRFGCTQCGRVFSGALARSFLVDHIKLEHMHQSPYTCDDCGQRFLYKVQADRHRTVDRDSGVASCRRAEDLPLTLPRLVFGCSRCAKIFAGEGAQSRYSEHQLECMGTPPAPGPSIRHPGGSAATRVPAARSMDDSMVKTAEAVPEETRPTVTVVQQEESDAPQTVIVLPGEGPTDAGQDEVPAGTVETEAGEQVVVLSEDVLSDVRAAAASQGGPGAGGSVVLIQAEDGTLIVASEEQLAELQMTSAETETAQLVDGDAVEDATGRTVRQLLQEKRMREASLLEQDQSAPESS